MSSQSKKNNVQPSLMNVQTKSPTFGANVYGVFHGLASDPNWNKDAFNKLPITFLKEAVKSGAIDIKNAAIEEMRQNRHGIIQREGYELPEKIELLLMDTTTPQYDLHPFTYNKEKFQKAFDEVKIMPDTREIYLFIDKNERLSLATVKDMREAYAEIAKMFKVSLDEICFDVAKDKLPNGMVKTLENNGYEFQKQRLNKKQHVLKPKNNKISE